MTLKLISWTPSPRRRHREGSPELAAMPEEIRLWKIGKGETLTEYRPSTLDLESRLEAWLERDISILAPELMVIGRQVETAYGGIIDLLCVGPTGDLTIVELKRHMTPREVTAQVLDYASWVAELSSEDVALIANGYLKSLGPMREAFRRRFGIDLPDSLNNSHNMIVVASDLDPSSERIINYLSQSYGVGINAATFQYFRSPDGEFLARTYLIEPSKVESRTRGSSKRLPNLTYEELESIAEQNGVRDLYNQLVSGLTTRFPRGTTQSSIAFSADIEGSRKTIFSLIPRESSAERGVRYQMYFQRTVRALQLTEEAVRGLLPEASESWKYYGTADEEYSGYAGYFKTEAEVLRFLEGAGAVKQ